MWKLSAATLRCLTWIETCCEGCAPLVYRRQARSRGARPAGDLPKLIVMSSKPFPLELSDTQWQVVRIETSAVNSCFLYAHRGKEGIDLPAAVTISHPACVE